MGTTYTRTVCGLPFGRPDGVRKQSVGCIWREHILCALPFQRVQLTTLVQHSCSHLGGLAASGSSQERTADRGISSRRRHYVCFRGDGDVSRFDDRIANCRALVGGRVPDQQLKQLYFIQLHQRLKLYRTRKAGTSRIVTRDGRMATVDKFSGCVGQQIWTFCDSCTIQRTFGYHWWRLGRRFGPAE